MEIAVMSWSFAQALRAGEMDTAGVVRFVRELGVGALELMDGFIRDEEVPAVEAALAAAESRVVCYDLGADFVTPDREARRAAVATIRAGLERAARFRVPLALVVPGTLKEGVAPAVARAWIAEGLKACVPDAARLGITLTIEDHSSQAAVYGRSDHLTAIGDAVGEHLVVTYDVGNFLLAGEDPLQALGRLGPRVRHVHFKDWHTIGAADEPHAREVRGVDGQRYTGAVLGEGIVDLAGATVGLRGLGYDGCVAVEYEGVGDPHEAVRRGVDHVRTLLSTPSREG